MFIFLKIYRNWKSEENKTSPASNFTKCGVKNSKLKIIWQRYHKIWLFLIFHFLRFLPNSYLPTRGSWEGSQAESAMVYIRSEIDNHLLPRSTSEWQSISTQDHTWICNKNVSYLSSQPLTRVFLLEPSS